MRQRFEAFRELQPERPGDLLPRRASVHGHVPSQNDDRDSTTCATGSQGCGSFGYALCSGPADCFTGTCTTVVLANLNSRVIQLCM
jgi:hypothetical protein